MTKRAILITGCNGSIGRAICNRFKANGFGIIGLDRGEDQSNADCYIDEDLGEVVRNAETRNRVAGRIVSWLDSQQSGLAVLVNNAAVQNLGPVIDIDVSDFQKSLDVTDGFIEVHTLLAVTDQTVDFTLP